MTSKLFSELGLSAEVLKAVDRLGFEKASPIQSEAIPVLLGGKDVVGQSQTGSGKTAAFAIPAIEKVEPGVKAVQVLILCPTRELAVQVSEEVHKLTFFKRGIHALPIYGGQSYDRQLQGLRAGAQIVIGTPGRVMDHLDRGTLRLDKVKTVVLDEADVMLNMGFRDDIEFVLQHVPAERQTVFFSATMPRAIQELIQKYARDPVQVKIEQKALTVPTVEQVYYEVDRRFKIELLARLIDIHDFKIGIVFCNTKRMVDDLVDHLNAQGYSADRLHGDMTQALRDRVMQKFRRSGIEFLVATDVAARGIDVDDVQVVFNFDLPYDVEDYVHRIGRTGRAGRSGLAISFVSGRELFQIRSIERFTRTRIERKKIPTLNEVEEARASAFLTRVRTLLQTGEYQKQDHLVEVLLEEGFSSTDIASALIHLLQAGEGTTEKAPDRSRPAPIERRPAPAGPASAPTPEAPRPEPLATQPVPLTAPPEIARPKVSLPVPVSDRPAAPARPKTLTREPRPPRPELFTPRPAKPLAPRDAAAPAKPKPITREPRLPRPELFTPQPAKPSAARAADPSEAAAKASRRTPEGQSRLFLSVGEEQGLTRSDLERAIMGETGLPATVLGHVDIRERHTFLDVQAAHANAIVSKLTRSTIRGKKAKAKLA